MSTPRLIKQQSNKHLSIIKQPDDNLQLSIINTPAEKRFQRKNNLIQKQHSCKIIRKSMENNGHVRIHSRIRQSQVLHTTNIDHKDQIQNQLFIPNQILPFKPYQSDILDSCYQKTTNILKSVLGEQKVYKYDNTKQSSRIKQNQKGKNFTSMQLLLSEEIDCVSNEAHDQCADFIFSNTYKPKQKKNVRMSMGQNDNFNNTATNHFQEKQIFKLNQNVKRLQRREKELSEIIQQYKLREAQNRILIQQNNKLKREIDSANKQNSHLAKKNSEILLQVVNLQKEKKHMAKQISQLSMKNFSKDLIQLQGYRQISLEQQLKCIKKILDTSKSQKQKDLQQKLHTLQTLYANLQSQFQKLSVGYRVMQRRTQLAQKSKQLTCQSFQFLQLRRKYRKVVQQYKIMRKNYIIASSQLAQQIRKRKRKSKDMKQRNSDLLDTPHLRKTWTKFETYSKDSSERSSIQLQLSP